VLGTPNFQQFIICIVRLSRHILPKMSLLKKLINFLFSCKKISFSQNFYFCSKKTDEPLSQIRLFFIDSIFSNTF